MRIARPLVLLGLIFTLIWVAANQGRLVSPSPENESTFLQTYTPDPVVEQFKAAEFSEVSSGTNASAGRGFATHEEIFEPILVIRADDWVALSKGIRDDITTRLSAHHARILEETGNTIDGFTIRYVIGNSEGVVAMEPVKPNRNLVAGDPGQITVSLRIRINEKWFAAGPATNRKS